MDPKDKHDLPAVVPTHVAIIMDGNGRWAQARGLPRMAGHRAGTENWSRPQDEVQGLMKIFEDVIDRELQELHDQGVQLRHIGRLDRLDPTFRQKVLNALEYTRHNDRLVLNVAFNYGGRDEIIYAIQHMLQDQLKPEDVTTDLVGRYLFTVGVPDPDLIIRTSGELRCSNFLLWQGAYSEWYFPPVYWPDFDKEQLRMAIEIYNQRDRRFGCVSPVQGGES